jgi:hypothetical protein
MVPDDADRAVRRYLRLADRLLPGRVVGFYLVGSVALGAFRPGQSDIDFVAVVEGDLDRADLRRLRTVHAVAALRSAVPSVARGNVMVPGMCNGVYVRSTDLTRPVSTIVPLASHVGREFHVGAGFDVNPVQWATLSQRGVAVRGPEPAALGLDPEPDRLRGWNLDNLAGYWVPWARAVRGRPDVRFRSSPRWWTAWGVLGPPRLHHTIATGQVVSKEDAGEHARRTFDGRWHPLIDEALAYRLGRPADPAFRDLRARAEATGAFALEVAEAAARL